VVNAPVVTETTAVPDAPTTAAVTADRPSQNTGTVDPGHVLTSDEINASVEDSQGNTRHPDE
jgi:hypothetical protein